MDENQKDKNPQENRAQAGLSDDRQTQAGTGPSPETQGDGGQEVSFDYRSAYAPKPKSKSRRRHKKKEPPAERQTEKRSSTLNAAANATVRAVKETAKKVANPPPAVPEAEPEPEMDDFLPEGKTNEDDVLLTKKAAPEPEQDESAPQKISLEDPAELEAEDAAAAALQKRHGRYRYGIGVGALVIALAFVGIAAIVIGVGRQIYRAATDDSQLRAYDTFLSAIVMQDPEPFESIGEADEEMIMKASLWRAVTVNGADYNNYDDTGRTLVPLGDVVDACHELFGPSCELQPSNPKDETFFEYDGKENVFHVSPYSSQTSFAPYTVSSRRSGSQDVLRVGYVAASDEWRSDTASEVAKPTPVKYMEYVLQKAEDGKTYYVAAIRADDQKK